MPDYQNLKRLTRAVVDMIWDSRPDVPVEHSVRDVAASTLLFPIQQHLGASLASSDEEALMTLLKDDRTFRNIVRHHLRSARKDIAEHYGKYGGCGALFAYCLGCTIREDETEELLLAKSSLLNWYLENRRTSMLRLKGGILAAWWPFDWFQANFDAIATKVVASVIFAGGKAAVRQTAKLLATALSALRSGFGRLPDPVVAFKHPEESLDVFEQGLIESGLYAQYLALFDLDQDAQEHIVSELAAALCVVFDGLSRYEKQLVVDLSAGPVVIRRRTKSSTYRVLVDHKLVRLVELVPGAASLVMYPEFSDEDS